MVIPSHAMQLGYSITLWPIDDHLVGDIGPTLCNRLQLETWKQRLHACGSPSTGGRDLLRPSLAASTLRCMMRLATCTAMVSHLTILEMLLCQDLHACKNPMSNPH